MRRFRRHGRWTQKRPSVFCRHAFDFTPIRGSLAKASPLRLWTPVSIPIPT
ncbi:MAG: hypothetical protein WAN70_03600 [Terriglobales bacterium]